MKLLLIGSWHKTTLQDIGARFASGDHSSPPKPCEVITRWHDPSAKRFWLVVQAPDSKIIQEWMSRWTDIVSWETHCVLNDDEVGEMLVTLL